MGMDMATVDAPTGLTVYGELLSTKLCCIVTNPTPALGLGHLMEYSGTTLSTPVGQLMSVMVEETGAVGSIMGGLVGLFDENFDPVKYIAAAEAGNSTIAGYALIADDPRQHYVIQEDGDTSSMEIANMGLNVDCVGVTVDTTTGRSKMELDSSTVAATNTLALKIHGPHPHDTISAAGAAGNHCRFIVSVNAAWFSTAVVGV